MTPTIASPLLDRALRSVEPVRHGRLHSVVGLHAEVEGVDASLGDLVLLGNGDARPAEVIAIHGERAVVLPYDDLDGLRPGAPVWSLGEPPTIEVGGGLLGRVVDGLGRPIDGREAPPDVEPVTLHLPPPTPLERPLIRDVLQVGVRSIDALVPCGRGQRVGIFSGSGVGKSSLLSMMVRGTDADVAVVAMVGERGREVAEFIERDLGADGIRRAVVVVATSDRPALMRRNAAFTATRIAEWFRDRGRDVLLVMDSVTRFAMAQREIGLSAGEVPAARGYTPSVFALLPRLLERAGTNPSGSITGFYTVLVEGDDLNDPVADATRAILDGHIVLSRDLANAGRFPAVDVLRSVSRLAPSITDRVEQGLAQSVRQLLAAYDEARDLIEVGAYRPGSDATVDEAVARRGALIDFLTQELTDLTSRPAALEDLAAVLAAPVEGVLTRELEGGLA